MSRSITTQVRLAGKLFETNEPYYRGAEFSPCGKYRYSLERRWCEIDEIARRVMFIGLNPSVADAASDDPTVRRLVGFAKAWGCNCFVICNCFAFVTTEPGVMKQQADPIGPRNEIVIRQQLMRSEFVVACWGNHCPEDRQNDMCELIENTGHAVQCFRVTKLARPEHPLYLPKHLTPKPFCWRQTKTG